MDTNTSSKSNINAKTVNLVTTIVETLFWLLAILGAAFKFTDNGGDILLAASLSTLAFFYMISGALPELTGKQYINNNTSKIARGALGVAFAVLLMGVLFRLKMWPNMFGLLQIPLFIGVIGVAIFSFIMPTIIDKEVGMWALPRIILIAVPVVFFLMHSNSEYYAMVGKYRNDAKYMELYRDCKDNRQRCEELWDYQDSLTEPSSNP